MPAERPGAAGGHPRLLPGLRVRHAGRRPPGAPLHPLHDPPRHLARARRWRGRWTRCSTSRSTARPRPRRTSWRGGCCATARRSGVPRGGDQLLLHGASLMRGRGQPGPGDRGAGGAGGDLGRRSGSTRSACPTQRGKEPRRTSPAGVGSTSRSARPSRSGPDEDLTAWTCRLGTRAHRAARGAAAAAAPRAAARGRCAPWYPAHLGGHAPTRGGGGPPRRGAALGGQADVGGRAGAACGAPPASPAGW